VQALEGEEAINHKAVTILKGWQLQDQKVAEQY
jgi:hypothetical protein